MTPRQIILKLAYPLWMRLSSGGKKGIHLSNQDNLGPSADIFAMKTPLADGGDLSFERFRGKKLLIVNTASDCGFTRQYAELQSLSERFREQLLVIGFPSNEFKEQEKGSNAEIADFCRTNYGVGFPIAAKSIVRKRGEQHPVFQWLTQKELNGWNEQRPVWNFTKYLVDEEGKLMHVFGPAISPLDANLVSALSNPG